MRRAVLALVTTVVGLVMLLSFRTTPLPTTAAGVGTAAAASSAADQPGTTSATGASVETGYGPVQVQATVSDGTLTSVIPVSLPGEEPRSAELSARAAPQLAQEAVDTQSAALDMVSGATYTSRGYAQSLQSALDQVPALTTTGQG